MAQLLQYYKRSFQQQPRPPAANLQPTFEDLSIDDKLSELQRLLRYSRSAIGLQRLVHVKMLTHVAADVGFWDTNAHIFPILGLISNDQEPAVRQHLMEQLALLAKFCCEKGGEDGYTSLITCILPIIASALEDEKSEVRYAASSSLVSISKLMQPEDLGQHILTIALQLAHEDEKEDRRMTAAVLLNSLAEIMGTDLCKQFVIPEVISLAEDPVFRVRKSIALNFHNICKMGGEFELFERLMPAFVRLSKDDMYRVRRACAESIAEIAKYVSDDIRVGVLSEIYLRLVQDPSRLVKQSALQQSGMFIVSLPRHAVNDSVLGNYCSMAMSPTGDGCADAELRQHCAFCFPAVLQTIGVSRWPEVRELYRALVQSRSIIVKQTLACSLHEVARILNGNEAENVDEIKGLFSGVSIGDYPKDDKGNIIFAGGVAVVEGELIPIFESMLQDEEAVQMGVMRHLADFLRMLSVPCRVSYLPLLHDILHSTNLLNWRLRQCLAVQLPALLLLPPPELVFNTLFTLVMTLLQDPVASVRKGSFLGVAKMVKILSKQSDYVTSLYNEIQDKDNCGETVSPTGSADSVEFPLDFHNEGYQRKKSYKRQYHNIAVTAAHHVDIVSNAIQTLVQGKSYHLRQLWAELAHALLLELPQSLFEKHFLDGLLYLASDPVSNVRVAVAAVLAGWESYDPLGTSSADTTKGGSTINVGGKNDESNNDSSNNNSNSEVSHLIVDDRIISNCPLILNPTSPWSWLLKRLDVAQCIMRLSGDDKDVYQEIHKLQPIFPEIIFRVVSCKGMKVAPGGQSPVWNMYEVTESQLATCEASPATHLSDGCSSSSDDGECGRGIDKEYHYTASSEDDECSSRSYKRILNQNFNHNQSFSELPIESKDGDKDLLLPLESKILNQKEIPIAANTKMGRSCDTRISRYAITVADYEFADNQQALADRDSSEHIGTSNYMGSPANLKNSGDALGQGLRLASPVRDMSHGFVVRSPVRKVEATAVLLQQQKEEREEERLIHLKTKRILSMECDDNDLSENEINGIHGNFDSHISKVVLQQESPNLRRRMTTHSIFEQTTYDDSDDDESSNDFTDISVDRISLSSTYSESRHINVLPSLHFVTSQQSAVSKTHEYAIPDSSDCSGHFGDIDILGHFERETPSSSSSSRNQNQTESLHLPQEIFFSDQILSLEQCDVMTSNSNTFFLSQQPLERITGSVAQETIKIDNLHNVATTIDLGNIGPV